MKLPAILALLLGLAATPVWAAGCNAPKMAVPIPDGATASRDAMLAAKKALAAYQTATQNYMSCVADSAVQGAGLQDKALAALRETADRFNAELRKFKERNGG